MVKQRTTPIPHFVADFKIQNCVEQRSGREHCEEIVCQMFEAGPVIKGGRKKDLMRTLTSA